MNSLLSLHQAPSRHLVVCLSESWVIFRNACSSYRASSSSKLSLIHTISRSQIDKSLGQFWSLKRGEWMHAHVIPPLGMTAERHHGFAQISAQGSSQLLPPNAGSFWPRMSENIPFVASLYLIATYHLYDRHICTDCHSWSVWTVGCSYSFPSCSQYADVNHSLQKRFNTLSN